MSKTYKTDPYHIKQLRAAKKGRLCKDNPNWKNKVIKRYKARHQTWAKTTYKPLIILAHPGVLITDQERQLLEQTISQAQQNNLEYRFAIQLRYCKNEAGMFKSLTNKETLVANFKQIANDLFDTRLEIKKDQQFREEIIMVVLDAKTLQTNAINALKYIKNAVTLANHSVHPNHAQLDNYLEIFLETYQEEPLDIDLNFLASKHEADARHVKIRRQGGCVHIVDSRDNLPINADILMSREDNGCYSCSCDSCIGPDVHGLRSNTASTRDELLSLQKHYNAGEDIN